MARQVVPNIKDINFWEQFTTGERRHPQNFELFRISKISTFESNSQLVAIYRLGGMSCSEYQRYQLLRAIHNHQTRWIKHRIVVPNIKDINFWEQFTTSMYWKSAIYLLFRISKISTFESNSQRAYMSYRGHDCCSEYQRYQLLRAIHNWMIKSVRAGCVVPNIKDINFWEQFTTIIGII